MPFQVKCDPHSWPQRDNVSIAECAVVVIDMQHDYCSPGFYMDKAGYDLKRLRQPIVGTLMVLESARHRNLQVIYTRHGRKLLSNDSIISNDFPRASLQGEKGWEIVPELLPSGSDIIVEKSTYSAFVSGQLDYVLRSREIRYLAFCGNTIDVCVHSSLRSAVDLGYECMLLSDCCGAVDENLHQWATSSVKVENGVFGTVGFAENFVSALGGPSLK